MTLNAVGKKLGILDIIAVDISLNLSVSRASLSAVG